MQFSQKQNEYIKKANKRWNFKIGAVRSGKTYVDVSHIIPWRLRALRERSGLNVILGISKSTIERNVLEPMRETFGADLVSGINSRNIAIICGVPVYCLGAEKISQVSKIQGASIKYCYGDEVAKWNKEVFVMLQSRLDKEWSCFDGSCNPESPGHWLKEFLDREDLDSYIQKYTLFDNPFLPQAFVENLCKEYEGTVYYGRYIEGEWTLAEGLIYPMYKEAIAEPPEEPSQEYCISCDYGTQNAFAAVLWAKYGNVWYAVDEYYYSGRDEGSQKTDEEYADDLEEFQGRYFSQFETHTGEPMGVPRPMPIIIDPSAASFIEALRRRRDEGLRAYSVIKADNSVADGIRETATAMRRGIIKFAPTLKAWKKEVQGYVWADNTVEDAPIKVNDHEQDAVRYFVKTKRLIRRDDKLRNRQLQGVTYEDVSGLDRIDQRRRTGAVYTGRNW